MRTQKACSGTNWRENRKFKPPFPHARIYRRPDKRSIARCLLKNPLARGFFGPCVDPNRLTPTQFDYFTRAQMRFTS